MILLYPISMILLLYTDDVLRSAIVTHCTVSLPTFVLSQREMKIAVIENEYGAVSIDTALVEENVREVRRR